MLPSIANAADQNKDNAVNISNYRIENDPTQTMEDKKTEGVAEEQKVAPTLNHEKNPHIVATTLFDKGKDRSSTAKMI